MSASILVWGRLATVAFIVVFGITIGFVHFGRFARGQEREVVRSVLERCVLVGVCALIIHIPNLINLYLSGENDFWRWAFSLYSVLNYYTLALLSVPLWLRAIHSNPLQRSLLLGTIYWMVGAVILEAWAEQPLSWSELIRMHIVSGPYAYFQLSGVAILSIPVGIYLRSCVDTGQLHIFVRKIFLLGILLAFLGLVAGAIPGEFSIQRLADGSLKTPPRIWYWLMFGGLALTILILLIVAHKTLRWFSGAMALVALFGQAALPIFTTHGWVLPLLNWLDEVLIVEGVARMGLGLGIFGVFCGAVMYYYDRKNAGKRLLVESAGS